MEPQNYLIFVLRVDSSSSNQEGLKCRDLGLAAAHDSLPLSSTDQPAVSSDVYAAPEKHEDGKASYKKIHVVKFVPALQLPSLFTLWIVHNGHTSLKRYLYINSSSIILTRFNM